MRINIAGETVTTEHENALSLASKVAASATESSAARCSAVCNKQIDPVFNPNLRCQSQCDQREGHSSSHNCPTHGFF